MKDNKVVALFNAPSSGLRPPSSSRGEGKNRRGFTLMELLVVVLIIAILVAVAAAQYQKATDKTLITSSFPVLQATLNAQRLYKLEHGSYTTSWEQLDVGISPIKTAQGSRIDVANGYYYLARYGSDGYVSFRPSKLWTEISVRFDNGRWLCYTEGTPRGKSLCKQLGCEEVRNSPCAFKPS